MKDSLPILTAMRLFVICLIALSFFLTSTSAQALTPIIYDEFSGPDLGPWQVVQNEGSYGWDHCLDVLTVARWRIKNGWLRLAVDGVPCVLTLAPWPEKIITSSAWQIDFDWKLEESVDMDRNFVWWWQDKENWYDLKLYGTGLDVQKVVAGASQTLVAPHTTYPFQPNQFYHFTIKYQARQVKIFINQENILTVPDQEPFLSGAKTIAFKTQFSSKRSVSAFDNLQVFNLEPTQLPELELKLLKQSDPVWAKLEYDSAQLWSTNPTFERWACALVSMTMVLHYYDLKHLPDGESLTPVSLNQWLLNQADGYLGDGLVNWLAISRLTAEISQKYQTVKLEYRRETTEALAEAIRQIQLSHPVILNLPGHFVVGSGYTPDLLDLTILDPYYPFRFLSQHPSQLASIRTFTPSHTDLSYLLAVTEPGQTINFVNPDGRVLANQEQFIEEIVDPIDQTKTQKLLTQLRQPPNHSYQLRLENPSSTASLVKIFSYGEQGQLSTQETLVPAQSEQTVEVEFDKTAPPSNIIPTPSLNSSWNSWAELLKSATSTAQINDWRYSHYLSLLTETAQQASVTNQPRYQKLLLLTVKALPLPESLKQLLLQSLYSLNLVI